MDRTDAKRILFVDGDPVLRGLYCEVLNGAGYSVETAPDGVCAFGKLSCSDFDIVITDLNAPRLDGISLYLNALKACSHMKDRFLFMTDLSEDAQSHSVLSLLTKNSIVKPFDIAELLRDIETITKDPAPQPFSGQENAGPDKRAEKRFYWEEDCRVSEENIYNPKPFTSTIDVSHGGIRIRYIGIPLKAPSTVRVYIKCLKVRSSARVVWSRPINGIEAASGLKLSEPISSGAILTVVQAKKSFIPPLVSSKK